jgi:hypothetical protein
MCLATELRQLTIIMPLHTFRRHSTMRSAAATHQLVVCVLQNSRQAPSSTSRQHQAAVKSLHEQQILILQSDSIFSWYQFQRWPRIHTKEGTDSDSGSAAYIERAVQCHRSSNCTAASVQRHDRHLHSQSSFSHSSIMASGFSSVNRQPAPAASSMAFVTSMQHCNNTDICNVMRRWQLVSSLVRFHDGTSPTCPCAATTATRSSV